MGYAKTIEEILEIKVIEMGGNEEIFSSEDWRHAFEINEPIYTELCHEFFSTFEFNEEGTREELSTKKIIRFKLGGQGTCYELLEFCRRLGLFNLMGILKKESVSEGFTKDDHVRTVLEDDLGYDKIQRNEYVVEYEESQIICGQFMTKLAKKLRLLSNEVLDVLGAPIFYRYLEATTLREDLSDKKGHMEIRQCVLERMSRRQSYHSDRYASVFEHMAGHYGVHLDGDYAPAGYDEQQQ
ncbi:hypothetical protein Tco_0695322 [Tanacetum coccineum]